MFEVQGLHHVSLIVHDVPAALGFYCGVLGLEQVPAPANFDFTVAWVRRGQAEIHLVQANEAVQAPGDKPSRPTPARDATFARHVCLQINDVQAMIERLAEHAVPIVAGPRPRGDGPVQTYVYDPDGHLIELVCLAPVRAPEPTSRPLASP